MCSNILNLVDRFLFTQPRHMHVELSSTLNPSEEAAHRSSSRLESLAACRSRSIALLAPEPKRFTRRNKPDNLNGDNMGRDREVIRSARRETGLQIRIDERTGWTETDAEKDAWIATFEGMCAKLEND